MSTFPYKIITTPREAEHPLATASRKFYHGYRGWRPRGFRRPPRGPLPIGNVVPRDQWLARIREIGEDHLGNTINLPAKDQNGLGYCWVYGSTRAAEIQRVRIGLPALDLCPESVAGPCTGWRNEGGYAVEAFGQMENSGIAEQCLCPRAHNLDPRLWDKRWQQNALEHHTPRWFDIEQSDRQPTYDELVSVLLTPQPVATGLPWWNHLVCAVAALELPPETDCPANVPTGEKIGILIQNSWGQDWPSLRANGYAVLVEQLATPDGAASPVITL